MREKESILFHNNPSPMWMCDAATGKIVEVNRAAVQQYGYSREEFRQHTFYELQLDQEGVAKLPIHDAWDKLLDEESHIHRHKRKNGDVFSTEIALQRFEYEGRNVVLVQGREVSHTGISQERLENHLVNSPLAMLVWDGQLRLRSMSERMTEIIGYTPDDLLGKTSLELVSYMTVPGDREYVQKEIGELVDGKKSCNTIEARIIARDGSIRYTRWNCSALRDPDNRLSSILSMVEDLTEQKELQKKWKRMLRTVESTSDIMVLIDSRGKVQHVNRSGRETLGLNGHSENRGNHVSQYVCAKTYRHLKRKVIPRVRERGVWQGELQLNSREGTVVPVSSVVLSHKDDDEGVEYYSVSCRDISERLRIQKQLREREQRLMLAIEGGGIGFWSLYLRRRYLEFNSLWLANILGYDQHRLSHNVFDWLYIIHPDDRKRVINSFRALYKGETSYFETEFRLRQKWGTWVWILSRAKIVERDNDGVPVRVSGIHLNINDRKTAEQQLRKSLHEKQVLLEEVHHRVKNNLAIISSMLQLQRFKADSEELTKLLTDSEMRIKSIALVHEKLYESEQLSRIDFRSYINGLVTSIKNMYDPIGKVHVETACDTVPLNVNQAVPLALILNEVLSNAFEHAFDDVTEGRVKVKVGVAGDNIEVHVQDDGKGLPADFAVRKQNHIGIMIIETLAEQLGAQFEIKGNNGTDIRLSFSQKDVRGSSSAMLN